MRVHVSNILSRVNLASRTQAALYAVHKGLATLDESSVHGARDGARGTPEQL